MFNLAKPTVAYLFLFSIIVVTPTQATNCLFFGDNQCTETASSCPQTNNSNSCTLGGERKINNLPATASGYSAGYFTPVNLGTKYCVTFRGCRMVADPATNTTSCSPDGQANQLGSQKVKWGLQEQCPY